MNAARLRRGGNDGRRRQVGRVDLHLDAAIVNLETCEIVLEGILECIELGFGVDLDRRHGVAHLVKGRVTERHLAPKLLLELLLFIHVAECVRTWPHHIHAGCFETRG